MSDAGASTHYLDIARFDPADIPEAVFVRNGGRSYVGDDLHVLVAVHRKAGARRDFVVVSHHETAKRPMYGCGAGIHRKMMLGLEPPIVTAAQ
jgi:hypothetical protein